MLKNKREGTFLFRFSATTPGSFTLSVHRQKKKIVHLRVTRQMDGGVCHDGKSYSDIEAFIAANKEHYNLQHPCSGSRFGYIFQSKEDTDDANYDDVGGYTLH